MYLSADETSEIWGEYILKIGHGSEQEQIELVRDVQRG
jgi:hypothetical protein